MSLTMVEVATKAMRFVCGSAPEHAASQTQSLGQQRSLAVSSITSSAIASGAVGAFGRYPAPQIEADKKSGDKEPFCRSWGHSRPGRTSSRVSHVRSCSVRYQKRVRCRSAEKGRQTHERQINFIIRSPRQREPRPSRASNCLRARQKSASLRGQNNVSAGGETMRRREFIALAGASIAWPFAALAQQAGRIYRLGFLGAASAR